MSQSEPTPDSRQIVDDLENDIVDVDGVRSRDEAHEADEAAEKKVETAAPDGTRAVPGSPEPPD